MSFFKNLKLKILKIVSGARHNLVLCDNFKIYSFGDNSHYQCSGLNTAYLCPIQVSKDNEIEMIDIFAGYNFSLSYGKNEMIFCWGDNSHYKISTDLSTRGPYNPTISTSFLGLNIGQIFAGINNTAIVLSDYKNSIKNKSMMKYYNNN